MDTTEGNKLIAEFMGYDNTRNYYCCDNLMCVHEGGYKEPWRARGQDDWTYWGTPDMMKYHSSWDWLMPVIGKISNQCEEPEELDGLKYALLCDDINTAWVFVVDYLSK